MRVPLQFEEPLCAEIGMDAFFPEVTDTNRQRVVIVAKRVCGSCIHQTECAEWAIANEQHGIWGGLTPMERRTIRIRKKMKFPEG